jgi:hypothetical protein
MAWLLNSHLKLNLKRMADFRPPANLKAQALENPGYSVFYSPLEFNEAQFRLIGNKSHPQPCIKESEGFDFILQISNAPSTFAEEWIQQIRKLSTVQWCGILKNVSEKSLSLISGHHWPRNQHLRKFAGNGASGSGCMPPKFFARGPIYLAKPGQSDSKNKRGF